VVFFVHLLQKLAFFFFNTSKLFSNTSDFIKDFLLLLLALLVFLNFAAQGFSVCQLTASHLTTLLDLATFGLHLLPLFPNVIDFVIQLH
jgi:hypothetical protein